MALQPGDCPGAAAGGCLTPATALGDALVGRLRAQGFKIEARVLAAGEKGLIGV